MKIKLKDEEIVFIGFEINLPEEYVEWRVEGVFNSNEFKTQLSYADVNILHVLGILSQGIYFSNFTYGQFVTFFTNEIDEIYGSYDGY